MVSFCITCSGLFCQNVFFVTVSNRDMNSLILINYCLNLLLVYLFDMAKSCTGYLGKGGTNLYCLSKVQVTLSLITTLSDASAADGFLKT